MTNGKENEGEKFSAQSQLHNQLRNVCATVEGILDTPAWVLRTLPRDAKRRGAEAVDAAIKELETLKTFLSKAG